MSGTPDNLSRSQKVVRVGLEESFGARLRGWILRGDAKFVDVARALGLTTNDLSDVLDGAKHSRAAWLELLPPAVELLYLAERAQHHALRLAPVATLESTMAEAIAHFGAALTTCGQSEADGWVDAEEATRDLVALRALSRKVEELIRHRERALNERGLSVVAGGKR